jgi:2'-5' RNA ligase
VADLRIEVIVSFASHAALRMVRRMAKRLFIALELPAGCREALTAVASPMPSVRWVTAKQLHLTLAFLGNVDAESKQHLRDRLAELRVTSFSLRLHGVGVFGGRRPTIIWAGVRGGNEGLLTLHRQIHRALEAVPITVFNYHPSAGSLRLTKARWFHRCQTRWGSSEDCVPPPCKELVRSPACNKPLSQRHADRCTEHVFRFTQVRVGTMRKRRVENGGPDASRGNRKPQQAMLIL